MNLKAKMKNSRIQWINEIPENWKIIKLKNILSNIGSGTTPSSNDDRYYGGDINWIQSGDIYKSSEVLSTKKRIRKEAIQDFSTLKVYKKPFIVLAMYGASIGNVAISKIDAAVNQSVCVIDSDKLNIKYLYYVLYASQDELVKQASGGTQPNISQKIIRELKIPIPGRNEQDLIVTKLEEKICGIDEIIIDIQKSVEKLKKYKQSLITPELFIEFYK